MCPDKKRPAENTCRIVKGLDAVWAHFCPPKPCLPLSIDGIASRSNGYAGKIRERANSVKLRGVIRYKPAGAAAELPCGKEQISEAYGSYYLGAAVQEQMCTALEQFCSPSGGVLYIQGCSGTGKTCTIGYLLGPVSYTHLTLPTNREV